MNFLEYNESKNCHIIRLKVKPNAKTTQICGNISINSLQYLKLHVKAIAENGKANNAIIDFFAKLLKIQKTDIYIISGHNYSLKILSIKIEKTNDNLNILTKLL
jgi:uncharacterized protein (TIGR00251 family)